jgi:hypothetical protein
MHRPASSIPLARPVLPSRGSRKPILKASLRSSITCATRSLPHWTRLERRFRRWLRHQPAAVEETVATALTSLLESAQRGYPRGIARNKLPRLADKLTRIVGDHPHEVHLVEALFDQILSPDANGH